MGAHLVARRLLAPASPRAVPRLPLLRRTMASSTAAPRTYDFLVILPDKPDALPRRLEARP